MSTDKTPLDDLSKSAVGLVMTRPSRIECAAIRTADGKVISLPRPARHHDIIIHMGRNGLTLKDIVASEQGFTTDTFPFVRRPAALRIAMKAGQLKSEPIHSTQLFSEDLW